MNSIRSNFETHLRTRMETKRTFVSLIAASSELNLLWVRVSSGCVFLCDYGKFEHAKTHGTQLTYKKCMKNFE